ncbi:MAG: hypothetical protein RM338_04685 [Nostoc sp. DedQUE12a]|nr:hypothetical protein [Nostoc sp. DedQUE12a]
MAVLAIYTNTVQLRQKLFAKVNFLTNRKGHKGRKEKKEMLNPSVLQYTLVILVMNEIFPNK